MSNKEYHKEWRMKNKDKILQSSRKYRENNKEQINKKAREYDKVYRYQRRINALWTAARKRAKKLNTDFNIVEADIIIPDICPILKIPIKIVVGQGKGGKDWSPSLDRLDPTKGYIKGNIQVISWRANMLKSNASKEELYLLGKWAESIIKPGGLNDCAYGIR